LAQTIAGKEYPQKEASREIMLNFWKVTAEIAAP